MYNYGRKLLEIRIKSELILGGMSVGIKRWIGVTTILVMVSGVMGYASQHKDIIPRSAATLSKEQVTSDIRKQQLLQNKIATQIRIIHIANNAEADGFAFVSFDVDGHQQYAILAGSRNGYSMST